MITTKNAPYISKDDFVLTSKCQKEPISLGVAILLCTYNGQQYLAEQMNSFSAQSYTNWQVFASDDRSKDDTVTILKSYQALWGEKKLSLYPGPEKGFAANFLSLIRNVNVQANYYTYSDQDDIWEADKLQRSIDWLSTVPEDLPALYFSRTRLVDEKNCFIGFSELFTKPPSFRNALVESMGGGNTMMFNHAAYKLLLKLSQHVDSISHDLWTYTLISGCGGQVFYDTYPSVRYRQHGGNLMGTNKNWSARFVRIRMLFQGRFKRWNDAKIHALQQINDELTEKNQKIFRTFLTARKKKLFTRMIGLKRSGIYRQTFLGNLGLIVATIFNKV